MAKEINEAVVEHRDRKEFGKRTILLTSWASVATALLLAAVIGGAIYLNQVRSSCDLDDGAVDTKTDQYEEDGEKEEMFMDDRLKTKVFIKRNKDGAITLIADIDYNTKISATYIAAADYCLLRAGEDMDWYHAWNAPKLSDTMKQDAVHNTYVAADPDKPVTDMSLVPRYMRPFCEGKQIYWTKTVDKEGDVEGASSLSRQKRGEPGLIIIIGRYCYWSFTLYEDGSWEFYAQTCTHIYMYLVDFE